MGRTDRLGADARQPTSLGIVTSPAAARRTPSDGRVGTAMRDVPGDEPVEGRAAHDRHHEEERVSTHHARRAGAIFFALVTLLVAGMAVLTSAAAAHSGSPNFRSSVRAITPAEPGVRVQVLNYDDRLQLVNRSGKPVVVRGYNGEPYIRVLGDGTVEVNKNSPAHYLNEDRFANAKVPPSARKDATPAWKVIDRTGRYEWHDHRIHYMAKGTPEQVKDKGKRTKIFAWQVPIEVGGRPAKLHGDLFWQPHGGGLPRSAMLALAALVFGSIFFVEIVRRRRRRREIAGRHSESAAWG
jgi:hypothetical protein